MTTRRLAATFAAWLLVSIGLWQSDADPSVIALAGIVAVAAAAGLAAFDLFRSTRSIRWPLPPGSTTSNDADDQRVPRTLGDVERAVRSRPTELESRLVALVDDRLHARHGIDRRVAPRAADDALTPALRGLVGGRRGRQAGRPDLETILSDIEAL